MQHKNRSADNEAKPEKAPEAVSIPAQELNELREKAARAGEFQDKYLRAHAEFDNYKKRLERERAEFLKFASEAMIIDLLRVLDDFDRAVDAAKNSKDFDLLSKGVEMTRNDLYEIMSRMGLARIESAGTKFDPAIHEAVASVETGEVPEDTVVEELQKGYALNGKVIRPARVKVAKRPG